MGIKDMYTSAEEEDFGKAATWTHADAEQVKKWVSPEAFEKIKKDDTLKAQIHEILRGCRESDADGKKQIVMEHAAKLGAKALEKAKDVIREMGPDNFYFEWIQRSRVLTACAQRLSPAYFPQLNDLPFRLDFALDVLEHYVGPEVFKAYTKRMGGLEPAARAVHEKLQALHSEKKLFSDKMSPVRAVHPVSAENTQAAIFELLEPHEQFLAKAFSDSQKHEILNKNILESEQVIRLLLGEETLARLKTRPFLESAAPEAAAQHGIVYFAKSQENIDRFQRALGPTPPDQVIRAIAHEIAQPTHNTAAFTHCLTPEEIAKVVDFIPRTSVGLGKLEGVIHQLALDAEILDAKIRRPGKA
jgi:hypothetical protein